MISWIGKQDYGPIGIDVGSRCVKMVQFTHDRSRVIEASRWDWQPADTSDETSRHQQLVDALRSAYEGRYFRGRRAVLCLSDKQLFLQNIRIPKTDGTAVERIVRQEIASRIPFPDEQAEVRHWEIADIRQGDNVLREVIVFACHRPVLERTIRAATDAGFRPVAVDVEAAAVLRSYGAQFRRDDERSRRTLIVHVGYSTTLAIVAHNEDALLVKYIDVGGRQLDDLVSRSFEMTAGEASALRRGYDDRQDAELSRSIADACRPIWDRLVRELSLCVRYHSVTFRGKPLDSILLGGGEASSNLSHMLEERLGLQCAISDPFRRFHLVREGGRGGQWDVAAGLALRSGAGNAQ